MNINFHIHPENINLDWFERIPLTNDTFHSFFYLFFLPEKLKIDFLERICEDEKCVYEDILNVSPKLCNNINDSDFIILKPFNFYNNLITSLNINKIYLEEAIKLNKKILLFYGDDDDYIPLDLPKNVILFTASGFLSKNQNIYGLPTFSKDYFRGKFLSKKLSISFCGVFSNKIRVQTIEYIDKEYSNFIIRDKWGGYVDEYYKKNFGKYFFTVPPERKKKKEFIKNIQDNLYGLCIRGGGNFSYRLGEVLMMGRIPIIIDTKCILPFRNFIPYEKNCIVINYKDINNINNLVEKYHNSHTEEELLKIQKENRTIWLKYFTPVGAFSSTLKILQEELKNSKFNYNYV